MKQYLFGDILVQWKKDNFKLKLDEYTELFRVSEYEMCHKNDLIVYETRYDNLEKYKIEKLLQKNGLYELYETEQGKLLIYHWATCRFAFGFFVDDLEKENVVTCYFNPDMDNQMELAAVRFFSCSGLHSKLLQKDALIFHSAYIDWNGKGILFAGNSGVGKSTQASLWQQYEKNEIINGDRTLLRKKDGIWHAYGYPCCGSSNVCVNRTLPLVAIILLEQGTENRIEELSLSQKFRVIFTGSERYLWSIKEMERVSKLTEEVIKDVKIVKFICRPEAKAVDVLKRALEKNFYE